MSEPELLELGADRPDRPRRRMWRLLLVAAVVLVGTVLLGDRVLRERTDDEVATCAERVGAAVQTEGRRVRATYEYVRFAAGLVESRGRLGSLYLLMEKAARRSGGGLVSTRDMCANIAVMPNHDDLGDRRGLCVEVLDTQRSRLAAVAADGRSVAEWLDAPRTC